METQCSISDDRKNPHGDSNMEIHYTAHLSKQLDNMHADIKNISKDMTETRVLMADQGAKLDAQEARTDTVEQSLTNIAEDSRKIFNHISKVNLVGYTFIAGIPLMTAAIVAYIKWGA